MNKLLSRRSFGGLVAASAVASPALADALAAPQKRPVLTVSGDISVHNDGDVAQFDMPMLEALGTQGFVTKTPWYDTAMRFDGVLMRTLLRSVGASGKRVVATALNDYTTEIPTSDFDQYEVLLAFKRNGAFMPVRDKGPLFIIYPFDSDKHLRSQTYYGRSAWQVSRLVVR